MSEPFLSIVIPAHNEESRLPQSLQQVANFLEHLSHPAEVIIVENGSADQTLRVAQTFAAHQPTFRVLHNEQPGKGRAVQAGMLAAQGRYRFFADADFSMPVEQITRFLPPAVDVPIAIASREAPGAVRYNEPAHRHFTGRVFNAFIRSLVLPGLHDTQCGFKLFRADVAEDLFHAQTLMGWSFDVELLYIASLRGLPILEVPIPWYYNPESKINILHDSWRMFRDLLVIRRNGRLGVYA
ncbi:MAG: glycosyl transferase [Anaerolineae bacterium CG_4_9_14_3_um_filter_57_17]|nr:glycosyltransferase family 2 protein [bacterium]NCT21424.1 glycosyltransferase family 2 protein [bacterium]OIO83161.1 MAG: glycosyl transferase [Anaerolineae bacterium CG2_30_57_67]PJB67382.1 MAG: glycosyl transferase [Anaerolineae bacterium CG_4_9_14_3_um_filter_57_17]